MNFTPRTRLSRWAVGLVLGALIVPLAACSTPSSSSSASAGKLNVVTAFYPFEFVSQRVAGDHANVSSLTAPGAEPHDLELTPKQTASIGAADLVVYQTGFQSAVDQAIKQSTPKHAVDVASIVSLQAPQGTVDLGDGDDDQYTKDPHEWLDPTNVETITNAVRDQLSTIDPSHKGDYEANAAKLVTDLQGVDNSYKTSLSTCTQKTFITTHAAFGYMARRYGLNQIGISGLSPDEEPSPTRIAKVQDLAKQNNVTTIFYETLISPKVAESIAGDLHLKTDVLDPLEGITDKSRGSDYLQVMDSNLTALKTANGCS
ncbi:Metal transport system ABC transporter substrate-binding protein [Propionibacterium freudenreichii]|uniref:metal ABC transporter substrate-binding protein n=1 Tax=Propionibacterium freudenreichii TaxID=1744 RepID=UPI000BC316E8|nr:metal ABC transporter substrate-binding protein [Propionibacterium freudenreichii]SBT29475.1 Metal transport system ABC transporter substrate-binding protein [Propionibacterium freudenreichii]